MIINWAYDEQVALLLAQRDEFLFFNAIILHYLVFVFAALLGFSVYCSALCVLQVWFLLKVFFALRRKSKVMDERFKDKLSNPFAYHKQDLVSMWWLCEMWTADVSKTALHWSLDQALGADHGEVQGQKARKAWLKFSLD